MSWRLKFSSDESNFGDFYASSKTLGEVQGNYSLTIRFCPIGEEITDNAKSLFNFIKNNSDLRVPGYTQAYFNGLTNLEFSKIMRDIILIDRPIGIKHIVGPRISKHDLLNIINRIFKLNKIIEPISQPISDRSMIGDYQTNKSWDDMVLELNDQIQTEINLKI